jgi:hypothetical protein
MCTHIDPFKSAASACTTAIAPRDNLGSKSGGFAPVAWVFLEKSTPSPIHIIHDARRKANSSME